MNINNEIVDSQQSIVDSSSSLIPDSLLCPHLDKVSDPPSLRSGAASKVCDKVPPPSSQHHPSAIKTRRTVFDLAEVEPWAEGVEGGGLFEELSGVLQRFVVLPPGAADALALWVVHTYAFELRDLTAYVGVESPEKRCGKTTLLEVLSLLVNRPVVAANISPPAIFRVIEKARPTLIIDEADTFFRGRDELRGILNAGYSRKTAYVVRVDWVPGEADPALASFSCWCPKVMAAIGHLPDTLADRCIVVRMQRRMPSEKCERLRDLETGELRRRCARWVLDHSERIASARPETVPGLHDRAADIWEPLLALADLAGGAWPERARKAATALTIGTDENSSIGSLLLDITASFYNAQVDRQLSRDLVLRLSVLGPRPWAELCGGKPITDLWLARKLRPYGIRPVSMRLGDEVGRGYAKRDFLEAFRRYVPRSEIEAAINGEGRTQNVEPSVNEEGRTQKAEPAIIEEGAEPISHQGKEGNEEPGI